MRKTLGILFAASALAVCVSAAHAAAGETVLRLKAIQVEPDVSSERSTSMTSDQPSLVR